MAAGGRLFLLLAACLALASAAPTRNTADCIDSGLLKLTGLNVFPSSHQIQSPNVQYLQDRTTVQIAQNFEVTYYGTFKVLTNLYPGYKESYVLYQCGTAKPDPVAYGLPATTKVMSVPLQAVSVSDTSVLNFMVRREGWGEG
ncbi:hypothetical protein GPECTOR_143g714 [Gonium pectorale]|uniref:Uncharacterized protein n=1 Tax=Gonium pectorale TaxID=33097 RepID=A0A150FXX7_GONPE|nr:hypothetical protein GPECTOR_143g714 [Gonium pectorale]|eukprot:KXZ42473.1 hypothetical protein GPECTOR_143g714 [Gonium pectorale]